MVLLVLFEYEPFPVMVALFCYCFTPKCSTRNSVEISGWWALVQSKEQWIQFLEEQGALWGSLGFPAVHQKKRWAFKTGKINGGYLAGGCDKYEVFECK